MWISSNFISFYILNARDLHTLVLMVILNRYFSCKKHILFRRMKQYTVWFTRHGYKIHSFYNSVHSRCVSILFKENPGFEIKSTMVEKYEMFRWNFEFGKLFCTK